MELITKMRINATPRHIFEAFSDPAKIGNFWFSTSSQHWEAGKTIALVYEEYGPARVDIDIVSALPDREIVFQWGESKTTPRTVTISMAAEQGGTVVQVCESGWKEDEALKSLLQNKEGWVFMLTNLKAYLENGVNTLRTGLVL